MGTHGCDQGLIARDRILQYRTGKPRIKVTFKPLENFAMDANHGISSALRNGGVTSMIDPADTLFLILNHYFAQSVILVISILCSMFVCRIYRHCTGIASIRIPRFVRDQRFSWLPAILCGIYKISKYVSGSTVLTSLVISLDFCESLYMIVKPAISTGTHTVADLTAANV
jgi:hypothetical protein